MSTLATNEKGDLPEVIAQAKTGEMIQIPAAPARAETVPTVDFTSAAGAAGVVTDSEDEDYPEDYPDYDPAAVPTILNQEEVNIRIKREDVRGQLAIIYTVATFGMFVMTFLVSILDALLRETSIVDSLSTLIPLVSGVFLGSLGFVLGYYFRKVEDE